MELKKKKLMTFTPDEFALIEKAAKAEHMAMETFIRTKTLAYIRDNHKELEAPKS